MKNNKTQKAAINENSELVLSSEILSEAGLNVGDSVIINYDKETGLKSGFDIISAILLRLIPNSWKNKICWNLSTSALP